MIYIGLGSNLPSVENLSPVANCQKALKRLSTLNDIEIMAQSSWYETAPVPLSDQPWFVNGVAQVETQLGPWDLLRVMLRLEHEMGRARSTVNADRIIDLDLLAYHEDSHLTDDLTLPHPRLQDRAFVLHPLAEIAPNWIHPVSGMGVVEMLNMIDGDQEIRLLDGIN